MDQATNTQTPQQQQHEPISFGIDQILNNSDQENSSQSVPRPSENTSYLCSPVSRSSAPYSSLPASFPGIGVFEESGSYSVNLSLAPAGVIRVPAHRPIPGAVPPPISSAIPAMPAVPGLGSLNFPWMESSRRFVKERFSGKDKSHWGGIWNSEIFVCICSKMESLGRPDCSITLRRKTYQTRKAIQIHMVSKTPGVRSWVTGSTHRCPRFHT